VFSVLEDCLLVGVLPTSSMNAGMKITFSTWLCSYRGGVLGFKDGGPGLVMFGR